MIEVAIMLLILGALIKYGRFYFLIAGYNTMTSSKKKKIDIKYVANIMWLGFLGMAAINSLGYVISIYLRNQSIQGMTVILATIIGVVFILIKSNGRNAIRKE